VISVLLQKAQRESAELKLLEIVDKLDRLGLLDALDGALSDEKAIASVMGALASDEFLTLVQRWKQIISLLSSIEYNALSELLQLLKDKRVTIALKNLVSLIVLLEKRGILDVILGALEDEQTFSNLIKLVASDEFLTLVSKLPKLLKLTATLDYDSLTLLIKSLEAIARPAKPVKGALGVLRELGDKEVAQGLGKVFEVLRELGKAQ
jgi:Protein of unknown function (DUF1641).